MEEIARKKKKGRNIEVELISKYLNATAMPSSPTRKASTTAKPITPRPVKPRIAKVTPDKATDNDDVNIPLPADRRIMQYTKSEAVGILASQTKIKTGKRMAMMLKMTRVGWAPTSMKLCNVY